MRTRHRVAMLMAVLAVSAGAIIGAAPADAEGTDEAAPAADARASWSCAVLDNLPDVGGEPVWRVSCRRGDDHFAAVFEAYGEHLKVWDHFPNDHHTYAYLDILDTPNVDYTRHVGSSYGRDFNLSITEGTRVSLKVCSSQTSGAVCSPTAYGRA